MSDRTSDYPSDYEMAVAIDSIPSAVKERIQRLEAVADAARVLADSPAGKRYGFLGLINALEALDE